MTAISKESMVQRSCQPVRMGILKTTAFPFPELHPILRGRGGCFVCFHEMRERAITQNWRAHFSLGRRNVSLPHPTLSSLQEQ